MTIAEQQKTFQMFAKMAELPNKENPESKPEEGLFPIDCLRQGTKFNNITIDEQGQLLLSEPLFLLTKITPK